MRAIRFASVTLSMLLAVPVWAAAPAYRIIDRIKIGDGRFDYAVFDDSTNRVYMSRSFTTTVIDVKTNKVSQLDSAANGHMTLPIPGTSLVSVAKRMFWWRAREIFNNDAASLSSQAVS
jgi:hypothetical protein